MSDFSTRTKLERQLTPDDPIVIDRSPKFFAFDGVDMHYFDSYEAAKKCAANALDGYKDEASTPDGWDDASFNIMVGIVCEDVQAVVRRDVTKEERATGDIVDDNIEWIEERELVERERPRRDIKPPIQLTYHQHMRLMEILDSPSKSTIVPRDIPSVDSSNDPLVCELTIEQLREKAKRSRNTGEFYDGY